VFVFNIICDYETVSSDSNCDVCQLVLEVQLMNNVKLIMPIKSAAKTSVRRASVIISVRNVFVKLISSNETSVSVIEIISNMKSSIVYITALPVHFDFE
jgi:hypothetical protein